MQIAAAIKRGQIGVRKAQSFSQHHQIYCQALAMAGILGRTKNAASSQKERAA
jgi:hypothetical protein